MQVSNSSVARPWKLEQNISGQASRQAGFEAGLKGLQAMEIEQNNMTKEGDLFWSAKRNKKQARKNGPPSSRFQSQLLLVKSAST